MASRLLPQTLALAICTLLPLTGKAVSIMVNEIHNGFGNVVTGTNMVEDEYVEFLVTEQVTSAQLAAMRFGDSNAATNQFNSIFQFDQATLDSVLSSAGVSSFMPGTLISVKGAGLGSQNLSYNPAASSSNNDAWGIELVAGQGAKAVTGSAIAGNFNLNNNGDIVWIAAPGPSTTTDVAGTQIISALGIESGATGRVANAAIAQLGSGVMASGTLGNGASVINTGSASSPQAALTDFFGSSPGTTNGGTNTVFITGLRTSSQNQITAVPEPSRAVLLLAGLAGVIARRRRR